MKKIKLIIPLALIVLLACNNNSNKNEPKNDPHMSHMDMPKDNVMMQIMDSSMSAMHKADQNGNPDHDFATMMIPHHRGAVEMAKELLKHSKSDPLINFAKQVITDQEKEIAALTTLSGTEIQPVGNPSEAFKKDLAGSMMIMMDGMKDTKVTGNVDHDFVILMIPHHQSAVEMAKAYFPYAKNKQIKKIAEDIIKSQEQEITWLKTQL